MREGRHAPLQSRRAGVPATSARPTAIRLRGRSTHGPNSAGAVNSTSAWRARSAVNTSALPIYPSPSAIDSASSAQHTRAHPHRSWSLPFPLTSKTDPHSAFRVARPRSAVKACTLACQLAPFRGRLGEPRAAPARSHAPGRASSSATSAPAPRSAAASRRSPAAARSRPRRTFRRFWIALRRSGRAAGPNSTVRRELGAANQDRQTARVPSRPRPPLAAAQDPPGHGFGRWAIPEQPDREQPDIAPRGCPSARRAAPRPPTRS